MKFKKETYLTLYNKFVQVGKDKNLKYHRTKIVKVRKQHICIVSQLIGRKSDIIQIGEYAIYEKAFNISLKKWDACWTSIIGFDTFLIKCGYKPDQQRISFKDKNYDKLIGKIVSTVNTVNDVKMKVAYIDYDFGITLVDIKTNSPVMCLNKTFILNTCKDENQIISNYKKYDILFLSVIRQIRKGLYNNLKMIKIEENIRKVKIQTTDKSDEYMQNACAFNQ